MQWAPPPSHRFPPLIPFVFRGNSPVSGLYQPGVSLSLRRQDLVNHQLRCEPVEGNLPYFDPVQAYSCHVLRLGCYLEGLS